MGRRLFLQQLADAALTPPSEISNIHTPEEGIVEFEFSYAQDLTPKTCRIRLLATEVDEYPDGNAYMLFTEDDHTDPTLTNTFEIIRPILSGMTIPDALEQVSRCLTDSLTSGFAENPINLDTNSASEDDFPEAEQDDDEDFGLNDISSRPDATRIATSKRTRNSLSTSSVKIDKIKSDLRAAKQAGFRVGIIGDLVTGGVVVVSIRVSKLGLSEEAMEAWSLRRSHYLVLLIRFGQGYRDLSQVKEDPILDDRTEMRVALCETYKPCDHDAYDAFDQTARPTNPLSQYAPLEPLFIGSPLNDLFRERFARIVNFRDSMAFNWRSAESFVNDIQGKAIDSDAIDLKAYTLPENLNDRALPAIVTQDALDSTQLKNASLPLVAMQFLLRHFVRCTEFCLVCHCQVDDTFEALKPYVCSKPLCLYQYMALGFGPSIEWEVLSQPYVVDLLVSFCYAAAKAGRLKEFPIGIDLKVPILPHYNDQLAFDNYYIHSRALNNASPKGQEKKKLTIQQTFAARLDFSHNELIFVSGKDVEPSLRVGDWLMIRNVDHEHDFHYRIDEKMFPTWKLSQPISSRRPTSHKASNLYYGDPTPASSRPATPLKIPRTGIISVDCYAYNESFDSLTKDQQCHAVITLLDTLPSVLEMKDYLQYQTGKERTLKSWRSRIADSPLNLLRWIIASNRSCIMQVDRLQGAASGSPTPLTGDTRVPGMDTWMQFRFAQGAPDKEQRFVDCVKKETQTAGSHPTLFAWHGSPLSNWHSIIRQGLRYDEIMHGRAYGNGVYMSQHVHTSVGYTQAQPGAIIWPNSALKISSAMSLQEVVNQPNKFVSKNPHYVVGNIDWIQTRYMFVKSELKHTIGSAVSTEYQQDPSHQCFNESGSSLRIPITAVSKSRRPAMSETVATNGAKKFKQSVNTDQETAEQQEDDANSVLSEDDDREFLESDADDDDDDIIMMDSEDWYEVVQASAPAPLSPKRKRGLDTSDTDFVPDSLDVSNIKFLEPPKDATPSASKALQKALREALRVQESTPLSKLGWYINPNHIENMYQWICELHSFPENLPLAKEMKTAGVSSIVLEMRFTNQFPFTPPFIRVVKPRFLPFQQGGGGNVTDGGAICMELLTNSGWSAATAIEMVLLQVRLQICDEERPARLLNKGSARFGGYGRSSGDSYAVSEAVAAYERACGKHGWKIPEGFGKFAKDEFT